MLYVDQQKETNNFIIESEVTFQEYFEEKLKEFQKIIETMDGKEKELAEKIFSILLEEKKLSQKIKARLSKLHELINPNLYQIRIHRGEHIDTKAKVRSPAVFPARIRSTPNNAPSTSAKTKRIIIS